MRARKRAHTPAYTHSFLQQTKEDHGLLSPELFISRLNNHGGIGQLEQEAF